MTNPNKLKVVSLRIAQVTKVYKGNPDIDGDKRLYCDIILGNGVPHELVPFSAGTVDVGHEEDDKTTKGTGRLHGIFIPPVKGQMIGVQFIEGHFENPICTFSIPFPWLQSKHNEEFNKKIDELLEDIDDAGMFHKSGSYTIYKKNGDIISVTGDVLNGDLTKRTEVTQFNDGKIRSEVFDSSESSKGFSEINDSGQWNFNNVATIEPEI